MPKPGKEQMMINFHLYVADLVCGSSRLVVGWTMMSRVQFQFPTFFTKEHAILIVFCPKTNRGFINL